MIDLRAEFERHADEYCRFERVVKPPSNRPDLCALILIDRLVPAVGHCPDMIGHAEHDAVWLSIEPEELAKVATSNDIRTLLRCGVRFDRATGSLVMFV